MTNQVPAVDIRGVRRVFGRVVAVDRVDLTIASPGFVGLIGHNGAGKSTLLQMLIGLLPPTEGTIHVGDANVVTQPLLARQRVGAVPEEPALYPWLTAREHLEFVANVRGATNLDEALELADLGSDADRPIREYSQGMRRKVALSAAILGDPAVLVLDEALNGLDPPAAARVKAALRARVDRGRTVLLSTHVVETVEAVADRIVMLAHGRIVADVLREELPPGGLERLFLEKIATTRGAAPSA